MKRINKIITFIAASTTAFTSVFLPLSQNVSASEYQYSNFSFFKDWDDDDGTGNWAYTDDHEPFRFKFYKQNIDTGVVSVADGNDAYEIASGLSNGDYTTFDSTTNTYTVDSSSSAYNAGEIIYFKVEDVAYDAYGNQVNYLFYILEEPYNGYTPHYYDENDNEVDKLYAYGYITNKKNQTPAQTSTVSLNKYLVIPSDAKVTNATASFTVGYGTAVAATANNPEVKAGNDPDGVTITTPPTASNAVFTNTDEASTDANSTVGTLNNQKYATSEFTVDFSGVTYTKPGIYRYTLTENDPVSVAKISKDTNTYYIDAYVSYVSGSLQTTYVFHQSDAIAATDGTWPSGSSEASGKKDGLVNTVTTKNLSVKKTVTGNMADSTKEFTFEISLDDDGNDQTTNNNTYLYNKYGSDGTTIVSDGTINGDGSGLQIQLKADEYIEITGLPDTATYEVKESKDPDYLLTAIDGQPASDSTKANDTSDGSASGTMVDNTDIVYTNNKNVTTPTGIVSRYMPFIVMAAAGIGVVAVYIIVRKRNSEADD